MNPENRKRAQQEGDSKDSPKKIKVDAPTPTPTNTGSEPVKTEKKLDLAELQRKKELLAKKKEALVQKIKVIDGIKKTGEKINLVTPSSALSKEKLEQVDLTADITPPPLILDDQGNPLIDIRNLKKNAQKYVKKPVKKYLGSEKLNVQALKGSKTYDPRVSIPAFERKKRTLNFLTPGTLTKKSQQSKDKIQAQLFEKEMEEGVDVVVKPEYIALVGKKQGLEEIPQLEWWDAFVGLEGSYEGWEKKVESHDFGILLEHPKILKGLAKEGEFVPLPLALTKKERKKMRRQKRAAEQEEKRQEILLGVVEPPKPKLKLSNLIRTKGAEAIENPTEIEEEVRRQMQERLLEHQKRNQLSKLTPIEKKIKQVKKINKDKDKETVVAVFRVNDLSSGRHKFKIEANAQQKKLTGICLRYGRINLVIVEGGPKGISFFKKLMLRRIDWNERDQNDTSVVVDKQTNECVMLWEGNVVKPNFTDFATHDIQTETKVKKLLEDHNVAHYFELAKTFKSEVKQKIIF